MLLEKLSINMKEIKFGTTFFKLFIKQVPDVEMT